MIAELYIDGVRVDLFKDENIQIKTTIQDIRDISKIFTDFTKTFNIPASKTNNLVFQHYYRNDFVGFDSSIKTAAEIKLNGVTFRTGYIKLLNVKLKSNAPSSYSLTFFGDTIQLKDLLGEDKIQDLPLGDYDHLFNDTTVLSGLTSSVTTGINGAITANDVIYPLLTHSQRYYMDGAGPTIPGISNIQYINPALAADRGINYVDLKPAIKVLRLIDAITEKYPSLVFSTDFFDSSNTAINDLYMWFHRNKGGVGAYTSGIFLSSTAANFAYTSGTDLVDSWNSDNSEWRVTTLRGTLEITFDADLTITPTGGNNYNILIEDTINGVELYRAANQTGVHVASINLSSLGVNLTNWSIKTTISSDAGMPSYSSKWDITRTTKTSLGVPVTVNGIYNAPIQSIVSTLTMSLNCPDIKVIDFLTGLFKMFNLTAYLEDGIIVVKTLDSYYTGGTSRDITKYIDVKESVVSVPPLFKLIDFKYSDPKTFLALEFKNRFNRAYGDLSYTPKTDGRKYEIKIPFEHMQYETFLDLNDNSFTDVAYGYFVDGKEDPVVGAPLLFYNKSQTAIKNIGFNLAASVTSVGTFNRPANNIATGSIHFGSEIDEFTGSEVTADSLFTAYYTDYITSVFDISQRLNMFSAVLPIGFMLNYSLADTIIIDSKVFKINSITTDLTTGKAKLELFYDV
jgi:hypothetical protein